MKRLDQRGETLVEVVMALGILSLVLVSSYALATGTFRLGRGAGERTQAVNYLQEQAEALRTYRDKTAQWSDFSTKMAAYNPSLNKTFCMYKTNNVLGTEKVWDITETDCKRGPITLAITASPEPGTANQQYNFVLVATWKTGSQDNNVRLTTKLVNQR